MQGNLILTRSVGESIVIGDGQIVLEVLRIGPGNVRLGVTAPASVKIVRVELPKQEQARRAS